MFDVASGADLPDALTGTKYSGASWTPDGGGFYYTYVPPVGGEVGADVVTVADRPGFAELRFHALGTAQAADPVVREATRDPQSFLGGGMSRDGHWLLAQVQHGWNASDVYFRDARVDGSAWRTLVAGIDANASVQIWRDRFYVTTDDGAPKNRVFAVDPTRPERPAWREIVAESPDATLEHASIVGEHLVLAYLRDAASELEIRTLDGAPRPPRRHPAARHDRRHPRQRGRGHRLPRVHVVHRAERHPRGLGRDRRRARMGARHAAVPRRRPRRRAGVLSVEATARGSRCSSSTAATSAATARTRPSSTATAAST